MCKCMYIKKSMSHYCEYYSCGFNFSVSLLPEYMCCCVCVCVYVHGWVCVIAGFRDRIFLLVGGRKFSLRV